LRDSDVDVPAQIANVVIPFFGNGTFFELGGCLTHNFWFDGDGFRLEGSVFQDGTWRIDGYVNDSEGVLLARVQRGTIHPVEGNLGTLAQDGALEVLFDRMGPVLSIEEVNPDHPISLRGRTLLAPREPKRIYSDDGTRIVRISGFLFDRSGRLAAEFSPSSLAGFRGIGAVGRLEGPSLVDELPYNPAVILFGGPGQDH
jgi:hypothetical protein